MDAGPSRQRRALRPSQRRLDEGQHVDLPPRLQHLARLPWLECYLQQLRTEGKSENTRKTYLTSIRPRWTPRCPVRPRQMTSTHSALRRWQSALNPSTGAWTAGCTACLT